MNNAWQRTVFFSDGLPIIDAITRYHQRRLHLLTTLPHITCLSGVTTPESAYNPWHLPDCSVYQEPDILYLTGLNQPHVGLILNPFTQESLLFLPPYCDKTVFWEGPMAAYHPETAHTLATTLQVTAVHSYNDYLSHSLALLHDQTHYGFLFSPQVHSEQGRFAARLHQYFTDEGASLTPVACNEHIRYRLCLDSQDSHTLAAANQATHDILLTSWAWIKHHRHTPDQFTEWHLAAHIKGAVYTHSPLGQSFPAIIASGANAAILHYRHHNAPIDPTGLLLLDIGVRVHSTPADISRTVPASGVFNPLQACLYDCVLATQHTVERHVKAGVTLASLNTLCWDTLEHLLQERFIKKGGNMTRAYQTSPHFVGHLLAHTVHDGDAERRYKDDPLQEGMVITNEPGLYGTFSWTVGGVHYTETLGIRIEDNLQITATGCINLSATIPKTRTELEALL